MLHKSTLQKKSSDYLNVKSLHIIQLLPEPDLCRSFLRLSCWFPRGGKYSSSWIRSSAVSRCPLQTPPRWFVRTGSTALTFASSIAPCLCSNNFLHFSVITQAWNRAARRMAVSWCICLAEERLCAETAADSWAPSIRSGGCCGGTAVFDFSH